VKFIDKRRVSKMPKLSK